MTISFHCNISGFSVVESKNLTLDLGQPPLLPPPPAGAGARCTERATWPQPPDSRTAFSHCFGGGAEPGGAESGGGCCCRRGGWWCCCWCLCWERSFQSSKFWWFFAYPKDTRWENHFRSHQILCFSWDFFLFALFCWLFATILLNIMYFITALNYFCFS